VAFRMPSPICMPYFKPLKFSLDLRSEKSRSHTFHPTFKVGSNVQQANKHLLESSLKRRAKLAVLSLIEGCLDNSIAMDMEVEHAVIVVHMIGYIESIHPCTILVHSGSAHIMVSTEFARKL
jgi:hypothetical protein